MSTLNGKSCEFRIWKGRDTKFTSSMMKNRDEDSFENQLRDREMDTKSKIRYYQNK